MKEKGQSVLGVMGGMGPLATQLFYKMIINKTEAHLDQEHLNMVVLNHATMPDRTLAIKSGQTEKLLSRLIEDIKYLEQGGAEYVAIPCNTSHVVVTELQNNISAKIINMIEVGADAILEKHGASAKIGILATDGTIATELYQKAFIKRNIKPFIPSPNNQERIMKIIYDGVKNGGNIDYLDFEMIEKEIKDAGCKGALMACTELSCFKETYNLPDFYMDAMEAMAEKAIILCGKQLKNNITSK